MREPLHHYMQVGIVHFVAYPCLSGDGPIEETIRDLCADDYFDLIEISWITDPETRARAKRLLETSGMEVAYCAHPWLLTGGLDLNAEDDTVREAAVEAVKRAIDDASDFGCSSVSLLSGTYPGAKGKAAAMQRLEASLSACCAYAESKGLQLVLEVFDRDIDKKRLIGKTEDALDIARAVTRRHANFGLMVDLSHLPLLGETAREALLPVRDYVKHVHLGNCCLRDPNDAAWGDKHPRFGYPGSENDVEQIAEFLETLFEIGYLGGEGDRRPYVSFEIKPADGEEPELVIANAKRKLNAAWIRVEGRGAKRL